MNARTFFGRLLWVGLCAQAASPALPGQTAHLNLPRPLPQNMGYAYTRTGVDAGVFKIEDQVAAYPGSRYGFVKGLRVHLDDQDRLGGEAIARDGQLYVPASFAGYLTLAEKPESPLPIPALKGRWVYSLPRPAFTAPATVRTLVIQGKTYVNFGDVGRALGLHVYEDPSGLVCIGSRTNYDYTSHEVSIRDSTISAFDMPEKFADPKIAIEYIPRLKDKTPADLAQAPAPPAIARNAYSLAGFNTKLLGAALPPPGVYPRLLFSPGDIGALREQIQQEAGLKSRLASLEKYFNETYWNPQSSRGETLGRWLAGNLTPSPGLPRDVLLCDLADIALYCQVAGDDAHGAQAATALANYAQDLEPQVDKVLAASETEFGNVSDLNGYGCAEWKGLDTLLGGMNFALAFDFSARWMTPGQKEAMQRILAKATYGRRIYSRDNPRAAADDSTWGLSQLLAAAEIEGMDGCDPEVSAAEVVFARSFLDAGLDENGRIRSAHQTADGLVEQIVAMIALARRGDNLWGHPHWRKLLPVNSPAPLPSPSAEQIFRAFYPATGYLPGPVDKLESVHLPAMLLLYYSAGGPKN